MRTIEDIKSEIQEITTSTGTYHLNKREINRLVKRIEFLNKVIRYLETNPSIEFLGKERLRLQNYLKKANEGFNNWASLNKHSSPSKLKAAFKSELGLNKIATQIKTLEYILKS